MTVTISVGEMKSSSVDISNARQQIELVLSLYEWAFQSITAEVAAHRRHDSYTYIRKGNIYIPKAARRSSDNQDEKPYVNNGIHYRVFYI